MGKLAFPHSSSIKLVYISFRMDKSKWTSGCMFEGKTFIYLIYIFSPLFSPGNGTQGG